MRNIVIGVGLFLAGALCAGTLMSQDEGMSPEDMHKAWERMNQKTDQHTNLAKAAGTWNYIMKHWTPGTGEEVESEGEAKFKSVLDGRWLRQDFASEWEGQPYQGVGYSGYDTIKKKYVSLWLDSMSNTTDLMWGTASRDGKTVTYTGKMPTPSGPTDCRMVISCPGDDEMTMEYYMNMPDGSEFQMMEIDYTRGARN